jgi:hypothetical protein
VINGYQDATDKRRHERDTMIPSGDFVQGNIPVPVFNFDRPIQGPHSQPNGTILEWNDGSWWRAELHYRPMQTTSGGMVALGIILGILFFPFGFLFLLAAKKTIMVPYPTGRYEHICKMDPPESLLLANAPVIVDPNSTT